MKRTIPFVLAFLPFSVAAQITIQSADMPDAGDTLRYRTTALAEFDGDLTGPGYDWHFEGLSPDDEGADTAVTVESTPLLYQFFFNNGLFYPDWNADHALRGTSLDVQAVQINDVYDYYKNDGSTFRNVGFGATINGLPASVRREPIDVIHNFPLAFGDTDSGASSFLISVPTLGAFGQDQVRTNVVDGWGTIYLPTDTFEVLRVKSTLQRVDTIYVDQFGFGFTLPEPETIEYKWLATGVEQPVLQVTTLAGVPTVVRFVYDADELSTGIDAATTNAGPALYPNPAQDVLRVIVGGASVEVVDADGRIVLSEANTASQREVVLQLGSLAPGIYSVRSGAVGGVARLVVVH